MTDPNDPYAIHVDEYLLHPPARVWRALTDPDLMARWLMPNDFKPAIGHAFTFRADPIPQALVSRRFMGSGWPGVLARITKVIDETLV
ncbi:hypothetical protein GCM10029978_058060 [Actinoallomurus acanthiterrae]